MHRVAERLRGDDERARERAAAAEQRLEARVRDEPEVAIRRSYLVMRYARALQSTQRLRSGRTR